jgi:dihydrofolate reductase
LHHESAEKDHRLHFDERGWLNRRPHTVDYSMTEFYPTIDTILWGRKTYDWALAYHRKNGSEGGMFDTELANYVFSRKPPKQATPGVEFVSER